MSNFLRAVRLTFRYKFSIIAAVFCAFMVSVLWGGNIPVIVYPIMEVCLKKETFKDWIGHKIDDNQTKIDELNTEIESYKTEKSQTDEKKRQKTLDGGIKNSTYILGWYEYYHSLLLKTKPIIDNRAPQTPFGTILLVVAFALVGTVLKAGFTVAHTVLSARIAQRTIFEIRNQMFRKVIQYEVNYFSREGGANTMNRLLSDTTNLSVGLTILYGKLIREPLKMIACLGIAAYISWQLLLLTLVLVPLAGFLIRWLAKSLKRTARRGMEQSVKLFGRLEEAVRSIRVVKAFCRERYEFGKFRKTNETLYQLAMKVVKYDSLTNPMTEILGVLMICIAILAGSYLVMDERTDIFGIPMSAIPLSQTMLIMFFALLAGAADPARKLSDIFTQFQTASAASDRVFEMIDRELVIKESPNCVRLPRHSKDIRFENVSFSYTPGRNILCDVSLDIPFGQTLGIVGPSGCGKSTMLSLIPRFTDPTSGEILIDGIPVQKAKTHDLRKMIGIVTQEPILFNETVFENIRYGNPFATEQEVIEAAKNAYAHEFIVGELPNGYENVVGPGGGQLSGGQRQRIALARAFLSDPAIFLLDEATSQIDLNSEKMIHDALAKFIGKRTTIIVTHRLSALALVDRIVVMLDGKIESVGTHEELLQTSLYYSRLQQIDG